MSDGKLMEKAMREAADEPERWWWLSFADGDRPAGTQFLGVAIVRARGIGMAVMTAHALGINPGGEVQGLPAPEELSIDVKWTNRLLTRAECEQFDEEYL